VALREMDQGQGWKERHAHEEGTEEDDARAAGGDEELGKERLAADTAIEIQHKGRYLVAYFLTEADVQRHRQQGQAQR